MVLRLPLYNMHMLEALKDKKIAILGMAVEGIATAEFLLEHGIVPTILDQKSEEEFKRAIGEKFHELEKAGVKFFVGKDYLAGLTEFQIIIRSPGIKFLLPEILDARKKGVEITSQTKLFFDLCPSPIIGITGT